MFQPNFNAIFLIVISPAVGSFLANVVVRLPRGESVWAGRSHCDHCQHTLGIRDLLPIVSWLTLRGHCRHCGERLDVIYPVVEIAAVGIAVWSVLSTTGLASWITCGLGWVLLVLAAIDWRHFILPNILTYFLIAAGVIAITALHPDALSLHLIGLAAGFLSFWGVARLYRSVRGRDGLGMGDAKLAAAAGAWTSWVGLPGVVLWACFSAFAALIVQRVRGDALSAQTPVAFGTHLCVGIWLVWLYGPLQLGPGT